MSSSQYTGAKISLSFFPDLNVKFSLPPKSSFFFNFYFFKSHVLSYALLLKN